jgi:hypothetical protein
MGSHGFGTYAGAMGRIHSTFPSAVNVLVTPPGAECRLVTFIADPSPGVPDGFFLRTEDLAALRACGAGTQVHFEEAALEARGIRIPASACRRHDGLVSWQSTKPPARVIDDVRRTAEAGGGRPCGLDSLPRATAERVRSRLRDVARALKQGAAGAAAEGIREVAGCGIGLTPSADDALVGIISILQGARRYATGKAASFPEDLAWTGIAAVGDAGPFASLLDGRTTDVSVKYLRCAQEGRFSAPLLELLSGLFAREAPAVDELIAAVAACGGSSGADTVFGIGIACDALLEAGEQCPRPS